MIRFLNKNEIKRNEHIVYCSFMKERMGLSPDEYQILHDQGKLYEWYDNNGCASSEDLKYLISSIHSKCIEEYEDAMSMMYDFVQVNSIMEKLGQRASFAVGIVAILAFMVGYILGCK